MNSFIENREKNKKVQLIIQDELDNAGINYTVNMNELNISPQSKSIIEITSSPGNLSNSIKDHCFPKENRGVILDHYTSFESFKSIINSKTLRLYSILKREKEDEFKPFSEDFNLKENLFENNGVPNYKKVMNDIFYTSFTSQDNPNVKGMWDEFGENGMGVKISFGISVIKERSRLRKVIYGSKVTAAGSPLTKIMKRVEDEAGLSFILRGISNIGAFWLPVGRFEVENESRLLVQGQSFGPLNEIIECDGKYKYIPLKIGPNMNDICELKIKEITVGKVHDIDDIKEFLVRSGVSDVKLIQE